MIYKHLIFIVNEHSRKGKNIIKQLHTLLEKYTITYDIHTTEYQKHATTLAEQFANTMEDETLLVAVGGDGTLNEVVMGTVNAKKDVPVSYIPTGSGNDFAQARNLSKNIETTIKRIMTREEMTELDVIYGQSEQENIVAVNSIGFGIDGTVISKLDETKNKQTVGKFSYLLTLLSAYFSQKSFSFKIETPDTTIEHKDVLFLLFANQKYLGGGVPVHPLADATDEIIDILTVEDISFMQLLSLIFTILTKENHLSHKKIFSYRVPSCKVTIEPIQYGQRDGELINKTMQKLHLKTIKKKFWL